VTAPRNNPSQNYKTGKVLLEQVKTEVFANTPPEHQLPAHNKDNDVTSSLARPRIHRHDFRYTIAGE
jgi:hypothetical protein